MLWLMSLRCSIKTFSLIEVFFGLFLTLKCQVSYTEFRFTSVQLIFTVTKHSIERRLTSFLRNCNVLQLRNVLSKNTKSVQLSKSGRNLLHLFMLKQQAVRLVPKKLVTGELYFCQCTSTEKYNINLFIHSQ